MKKLLGIVVLGLLLSGNAFSNSKVGYFQCKEKGVDSEMKLEINLSVGIMNIWLHDYGIYEVSDRNIKAKRKGIGSDNILRTLNFDRYTGILTFMAYGNKPYVAKLKCKKVSDNKIF